MISSEYFVADEVQLVIQALEHLGAGGGRQSRDDIDLSYISRPDISVHNASLHERLVLLRLFESPNNRPDLQEGEGRCGTVDGSLGTLGVRLYYKIALGSDATSTSHHPSGAYSQRLNWQEL
jgi:hypothetical protein